MAFGSIDASVGLLVAALELKAVQLVRAAMAGGDARARDGGRATPLGPLPNPEPPQRHRAAAVYEPRRHFRPSPRYEPRRVLPSAPRIEPLPGDACPPPCDPQIVQPLSHPSPIQPPWKVRLWENPPVSQPKIKIILHRPDIHHKGSLIDTFI